MPKVCPPTTNVMDKNKDVADDFKDGKGGFQDPGRRGRRRPEEPCYQGGKIIFSEKRVKIGNHFIFLKLIYIILLFTEKVRFREANP